MSTWQAAVSCGVLRTEPGDLGEFDDDPTTLSISIRRSGGSNQVGPGSDKAQHGSRRSRPAPDVRRTPRAGKVARERGRGSNLPQSSDPLIHVIDTPKFSIQNS